MAVMRNSRRRREFLFLVSLVENARGVTGDPKYLPILPQTPFQFVQDIGSQHIAAVPINRDRMKDIEAVKKVVNCFVPSNYPSWSAGEKLWFVSQIVLRIVAAGWRVPEDMIQAQFVRSLYSLAESFTPSPPPSKYKIEAVVYSTDKLRGLGMFLAG